MPTAGAHRPPRHEDPDGVEVSPAAVAEDDRLVQGGPPELVDVVQRTPACTSRPTTAAWPRSAARIRPVPLKLSFESTSAPCRSVSSAARGSPRWSRSGRRSVRSRPWRSRRRLGRSTAGDVRSLSQEAAISRWSSLPARLLSAAGSALGRPWRRRSGGGLGWRRPSPSRPARVADGASCGRAQREGRRPDHGHGRARSGGHSSCRATAPWATTSLTLSSAAGSCSGFPSTTTRSAW